MAVSYELRIDLPLLCQRFSEADRHTWAPGDIASWLEGKGFTRHGTFAWTAEDVSLDVLKNSEYSIVREL